MKGLWTMLGVWGAAVVVSCLISLAGLAVSVWVIVLILQWMGVI